MKIFLAQTEEEYKKACEIAKANTFMRDFLSTSFRWGWRGNLFLLEDGGEIIGFMQFSLLKRKPQSTLYYICITPYKRGRGFGKQLFDYYRIASRGRTLKWKVNIKNSDAVSFYGSMGYSASRTEKGSHIFEIPCVSPAAQKEAQLL